jgi:surfeit locus 1 family protein
VQAVTELGGGYWVMTPLQTAQGNVVLVNRGFVSPDHRDRSKRAGIEPSGEVTVTGLVRFSEPAGGLMDLLRKNDPMAERWYRRDVAAITSARHLSDSAPWFIDADATQGAEPVGGLTVISFSNNHLVYALTWFALALMAAIGAVRLLRTERAGRIRK